MEKGQCEQMHRYGDSTGEGCAYGRRVGTSNQRMSLCMDVASRKRGMSLEKDLCECVCRAGTSEGGCLGT